MEEEVFDSTDLGTFLAEIGRKIWLCRETLWGLNKSWREGESEDSAKLVEQFSADLSALGRQIMLVKNQLCQACALKKVRTSIRFSPEE